jgi:hypothetical protein
MQVLRNWLVNAFPSIPLSSQALVPFRFRVQVSEVT